MRNQNLSDLLALLAAENAAIVAGEYAALDDLSARKLALFDHLQDAHATSDEWRQVSSSLQLNQLLLGAAIKGIGVARDRITALRAVREGLQVYDKSGKFATAPVSRPDLLKKA